MKPTALRAMIKKLSPVAGEVCGRLQQAGHSAYIVGGAVRDLVRGGTPTDYDLATAATPEEVKRVFRRVVPTGIRHGTVTVLIRDAALEVTTFRTEAGYSDGRRPDSVTFGDSVGDDLSRRDFTINAMALDPVHHTFLDPFDGEIDLRDGLIRAVGDPSERFSEDSLRVLRAIRFAAQLGFAIEADTWGALCLGSTSLTRISHERVRDEINKILASEGPGSGFRLMRDCGALAVVIPELEAGVGAEQRGGHKFDVFEHSVISCDMAPRGNQIVRLAALLHDVGKPATMVADARGQRTFHGHDEESAVQTELLLKRLRYPNEVISRVCHLIRLHMFHYTTDWSDAAVRRFLARAGIENLDDLFALRQADSDAQRGTRTSSRALTAFRARIDSVRAAQHALSRKDLAVNGHDLLAAGLPGGPQMGTVIDHLFETVLDDPTQNTAERLLRIAENFYRSRLKDARGSDGTDA